MRVSSAKAEREQCTCAHLAAILSLYHPCNTNRRGVHIFVIDTLEYMDNRKKNSGG
jgi:hypothetical protein